MASPVVLFKATLLWSAALSMRHESMVIAGVKLGQLTLLNDTLREKMTVHVSTDNASEAGRELEKQNIKYWPKQLMPRAIVYTAPVMLVGIAIPNLYADSRGITYALAATLLAGTGDFLLAFSAHFTEAHKTPLDGLAYIGWVFAFMSFGIVGFHLLFHVTDSAYKEEQRNINKLSWKLVGSFFGAGSMKCAAMICMQAAAAQGLGSSGPHIAIVKSYAIIVAPFFYFYANERMTLGQVAGAALVVIGVITMAIDGRRLALLQSIVGMLFFAAHTIFIRIGELMGSPNFLGVILRAAIMPICGIFVLVLLHVRLEVEFPTARLVLFAAYHSLVPLTVIWSMIRAYGAPECNTGVISMMLASQSVVMTLMNWLIMGWIPEPREWLSMFLIVCGCASMCVFVSTQHSVPEDGNTDPLHKREPGQSSDSPTSTSQGPLMSPNYPN